MFKILLIVLGIWLLFIILRRYKGHIDHAQTNADLRPTDEDMVQCATCGVHFPQREGYRAQEKYYCSQEHIPKPSS